MVVKGLRIVDASIMLIYVSGKIASTVYAIMEKASDMNKEDWASLIGELVVQLYLVSGRALASNL